MADTNEKVYQIRTSDGLYDIEASSLDSSNGYTVKGLNVVDGSGPNINLGNSNTPSGTIGVNSKGNLSVEGIEKHLNLEAAQSIQLKPTNKIIWDTGRRRDASRQNEGIIEILDDDDKSESTKWGYLKVKSRAIDLRCHVHGGIALQPCGQDGSTNENKIKFESSRTSPIDQPGQYNAVGGDGMEFGTFNNLHTSLFTKDYRFNKDGMVYAVTRGNLVTTSGKTDYPTQKDDFKDIVDTSLGATWNSIVKTSFALNGTKSRSVKMDGSVKGDAGWVDSNLEIKTKTTYVWVKTPVEFTPSSAQASSAVAIGFEPATGVIYDGNDSEIYDESRGEFRYTPSHLKLSKETIEDQLWSKANLYSNNGSYYVLNEIDSPGIKIESDGNTKLISKKKVAAESPLLEYTSDNGGVEISAGENVAFDKSTTGVGMMIQSPVVKFDGPVVKQYNSMNISAAGKLEKGGYIKVAGAFNLQHSDVVYDSSADLAYVLVEPVYGGGGENIDTFYPDPDDNTKVPVFWDKEGMYPCAFKGADGTTYESGAKVYLVDSEDSNVLWACDTTKAGEMKAPKKAYSSDGQLGTGDADHLIVGYLVNPAELAEYLYPYDGSKVFSGRIYKGKDESPYEHTIYVTDPHDLPSGDKETYITSLKPTREWEAKGDTIEVSDIVKLVVWMKENNEGPWKE